MGLGCYLGFNRGYETWKHSLTSKFRRHQHPAEYAWWIELPRAQGESGLLKQLAPASSSLGTA